MTAFLDTNVLIRHLTREPPDQAARATRLLATEPLLLMPDAMVAECVYVLESFYAVPVPRVAELIRSALALPSLRALRPSLLLRALEVYEDGLDFPDAYLVAWAELTGVRRIASFDRAFDRVGSIERLEP